MGHALYRRARQARRLGAERQIQVQSGVAQVAQGQRLHEQDPGGVRPQHHPDPVAEHLAGEGGPVRRVHMPQRELVMAVADRACGGPAAKPSPGSGPGSPASQAPRPTPGSSEISSISPGPPTGLGPDSATTQARVLVRSSPAPANPVTSQPAGSGQGSQTGTMTLRSRPRRPSPDGV